MKINKKMIFAKIIILTLSAAGTLFSQTTVVPTVHFRTASSSIRSQDVPELSAFAEKIKSTQERYLIVGHADERGREEYNLALGDKRARSIFRYLVESGVNPDRLMILSKGESEPVDERHNAEAWRKNRRVEITNW